MTAPVPTPPRASAAVAVIQAASPAARYLLASILILFALAWATILLLYKEPITWVDAAIIVPFFLCGFALAAPTTLAFVIGLVKQLPLPSFGRRD